MAKRRKRSTGSVHLRKDGRWEGRMVIGYDEKGYPKTKNVLAKTKTECKRKLKELQEGTEEKAPEASRSMTFGEWLDYWYQNQAKVRLRPSTQQIYENWIYNHLTPKLGDLPLEELTTAQMQKFFADMKDNGRLNHVEQHGVGLSDRSVQACKIVCGKALDKAVEEHLIRENPVRNCKLATPTTKEMKTLTTEEMQRLLMQAKEEGFYELLLLELTTGLRRGELLALRWEDLDFKTGELRIEKQAHPVHGKLEVSEPKTNSGNRTIILPKAMLALLKEYRKTVFTEWMFPSPRKPGQPLDPTYVRKRLHAMLERAGCKNIRFHDLRHTFATMSLEHGMDIKTLSAIIDHASSATTLDVYAHVMDEMQRSAALCIDKGIAGVVAPVPNDKGKKESTPKQEFQPVKSQRRRRGTGCVTQISENLWEGRYSPRLPDGSKYVRDVYAHTKEECEEKLAALILEMKKEITELKLKAQGGQK